MSRVLQDLLHVTNVAIGALGRSFQKLVLGLTETMQVLQFSFNI